MVELESQGNFLLCGLFDFVQQFKFCDSGVMGSRTELLDFLDLWCKYLLLEDLGQVFPGRDPRVESRNEISSLNHGPVIVFGIF